MHLVGGHCCSSGGNSTGGISDNQVLVSSTGCYWIDSVGAEKITLNNKVRCKSVVITLITLREALVDTDSEKQNISFFDVVWLSVWTDIGIGAAWMIKVGLAWLLPMISLGTAIAGGLIVIPIVIWLAWNWFGVWLVYVWELSQPIRFWFRDLFQSLDDCGSEIGTRLIQVLSVIFIFPVFGCTLAFVYTDHSWILLPIPIGVCGMAWLSFGGEDWIRRIFAKLDDDNELPENTFLEIGAYEPHDTSEVVVAEQARITDPVERQRVLEALQSRRARFVKQIAFWENMQDSKYRDIQIIGLTEMGYVYVMEMCPESVDTELLLEVLKATAAEYDHQIAVLKAQFEEN